MFQQHRLLALLYRSLNLIIFTFLLLIPVFSRVLPHSELQKKKISKIYRIDFNNLPTSHLNLSKRLIQTKCSSLRLNVYSSVTKRNRNGWVCAAGFPCSLLLDFRLLSPFVKTSAKFLHLSQVTVKSSKATLIKKHTHRVNDSQVSILSRKTEISSPANWNILLSLLHLQENAT